MKNADYNKVIDYLEHEHTASGETVKDEHGAPQLRDNFIIEGINCEPITFNAECWKTNERYKKNLKQNEIKSHSYIISFDPRDSIDNGLTLQEVQQFGIEFVNKYMPGYQTIVCSHADGTNGSGNMHCHIVINSIRIEDTDREGYMDQPTDNVAGFKHRCTPSFEKFIKIKVMEMCQDRGLYQVNLLEPAHEHVNDREYYMNLRGKQLEGESYQTKKEYIRIAIRDCANKSNDINEFKKLMEAKYDIHVHESRGRLSYILPGRERGITDRKLGTVYAKDYLEKVIKHEEVYYDYAAEKQYQTNDFMPASVRKLVDIASNEKARLNKGYERAVLISNIKKTAETLNILSEKGVSGLDELEKTLFILTTKLSGLTKEIKNVERQIADLKNVQQLKNDIIRIQPVMDELKTGKRSSEFRKKHESDLIIYKAATEKLKQYDLKSSDGSELNQLIELKNNLYEQRSQMKKDIRDLENAQHNLLQLSGHLKEVQRDLSHRERS